MPGVLQPLDQNLTIVGPDGKPTLYFIKWAQQRQIDIGDSITLAQAQALIDAWAATRDIFAGTGLSGGGNLSSDVTLSLNAGLDNLNDVDLTTPPSDGEALVYDSGTSRWIPGSVAGGLDVQEEGSSVVNPATALNFIGSSVTVTNGGGGVAEITVTGGGGGGSIDILHVQDQKAAGTNGGTFTSGAWQTRTLNTSVTNTISGASLSSNQITLPAGTYDIEAFAPACQVNEHQARLQNITDATTALTGTSMWSRASSSTGSVTHSVVRGRITIAGTKVFELQHRCLNTKSTNGFGIGSGISWGSNVFSDVMVRKVS